MDYIRDMIVDYCPLRLLHKDVISWLFVEELHILNVNGFDQCLSVNGILITQKLYKVCSLDSASRLLQRFTHFSQNAF